MPLLGLEFDFLGSLPDLLSLLIFRLKKDICVPPDWTLIKRIKCSLKNEYWKNARSRASDLILDCSVYVSQDIWFFVNGVFPGPGALEKG